MELRNSSNYARVRLAVVLTCIALATGVMHFVAPAGRLSTNATGDPKISDLLRQKAGWGHHHLSAFVIADGEVRFGGLGADHASESEIGSITKTFNGELLELAVQRGDVTLHTTIADILGDKAGGTELADVTLEELATHTSGLPRLGHQKPRNIVAGVLGRNPYVGEDTDRVFEQALKAKLTGRGKEEYSNLGHAVLGQLLAINAGMTYPELIYRDILEPLKMDSTYVATPGAVTSDAPRGVWGSGRSVQAWEMDGYAPAGAIRSTPEDMAKYAQAIVEKQEPNLVWVKEGDGTFWHSGATFGFTADLQIDSQSEIAVYVAGDTGTAVSYLAAELLKSAQEGAL